MSKAAKAKKTGRRYSPDERAEIAKFVEEHNAEHGRGGRSAASRKFGISPLTLSLWAKGAGKAAKSGGKKGGASDGGFSARIARLSSLAKEIDTAERKIKNLKARFDVLKARL